MTSNLIDEERQQPRTFRFKTKNVNIAEFEIPMGYAVSRLPKDKSYSNDVFSFQIDYKQEDNKVILKRTYSIKSIQIDPEQFENWNDALKELSNAYRDLIILEKTGA